MGWPGMGIRRGLRRPRGGEAFWALCLPWLRSEVRPFWRVEPGLEREVLAQLLDRGE